MQTPKNYNLIKKAIYALDEEAMDEVIRQKNNKKGYLKNLITKMKEANAGNPELVKKINDIYFDDYTIIGDVFIDVINEENNNTPAVSKSKNKSKLDDSLNPEISIKVLKNILFDYIGVTEKLTVQQLAEKYGMPVEAMQNIIKSNKINRKSNPWLEVELEQLSMDEAKALVNHRKSLLAEAEENRKKGIHLYSNMVKSAANWEKFNKECLDEVLEYIKDVTEGNIVKSTIPTTFTYESDEGDEDEVAVICLNDTHFGLKADKTNNNQGREYNSEIATEAVDKYAKFIVSKNNNRKSRIDVAHLFVLGDILHGLTGETIKGTQLECDVVKLEQFQAAHLSILEFINTISKTFKFIEVHVVKGNHAGWQEMLLMYAVSQVIKIDNALSNKVRFHLYDRDLPVLNINNNCIGITHGASSEIKAKMPTTDAAKEVHVMRVFDSPEYKDIRYNTNKVYLFQGDLHHHEQRDYGSYTHITLPTLVAGCSYADSLGYITNQQQKSFIFSPEGITEEWTFNFKS